jgi:hypothetical protein
MGLVGVVSLIPGRPEWLTSQVVAVLAFALSFAALYLGSLWRPDPRLGEPSDEGRAIAG